MRRRADTAAWLQSGVSRRLCCVHGHERFAHGGERGDFGHRGREGGDGFVGAGIVEAFGRFGEAVGGAPEAGDDFSVGSGRRRPELINLSSWFECLKHSSFA